jgi:PAS domain S-box-containing protein
VNTVVALKQRVNELEELQRRLSESERKYRTLVETMNEGVLVVDGDGKIHYCNSFFSGMLGCDDEEIIGNNVSMLLDDENLKVYREQLNSSHTFELQWKERGGGGRSTLASTAPYNTNNVTGTLLTIADLTTIKYYKSREELKTALSNVLPLLLTETLSQRRDAVIGKLSAEVEKLLFKKFGSEISLKKVGEMTCGMMNDIGGEFMIEEIEEGFEVINTRCPWGEKVHHTYCMLTRSIFTRIFSKYNPTVVVDMEKTLGNMDECCKLIIKAKNIN